MELESWEDKAAWEVELITAEGNHLEVFISTHGEILDEKEGLPVIGGELSLGLGVFWEKSPYKGVGYEADPVPIIQYRNGPFQIATEDGIEFSYLLFEDENFSIGPLGSLMIGGGFEEDDSSDLTGMDEPESTLFHGGFFSTYETPYFDLGLKFLNELQGEHSGQQIELSIEREYIFGEFEIEPSFSIEYQSSDWTDYFYGVSRNEVRSGRAEYDPGSAVNFSVGLMAQRKLSNNMSLIGMIECTKLDSSIDNSPIVEEDLILETFFGIMYNF
jgi:outer membrane protein